MLVTLKGQSVKGQSVKGQSVKGVIKMSGD